VRQHGLTASLSAAVPSQETASMGGKCVFSSTTQQFRKFVPNCERNAASNSMQLRKKLYPHNRFKILCHVDLLLGNDREISSYTITAARQWPQHIRNNHQWSNWEAVFSTRSVRKLRDARLEDLLGEAFSMRSVPKCYKQDKSRIQLVVRQSPASKGVKMELEESTAFEAVTRQRLVKIQQNEKN
jgi:hypothetical protein